MTPTSKSRSLTLVFFATSLLLTLAFVPTPAAALQDPYAGHAREHKRMIKKRIPALSDALANAAPAVPIGVEGSTNGTTSAGADAASQTSASAPGTTTSVASVPTTSLPAGTTTSASGGLLGSLTSLLASGTTTSVATTTSLISLTSAASSPSTTVPSTTSVASSPTSAAPSSASPTSAAAAPSTPASNTTPAAAKGPVTQTVIVSGVAASATAASDPSANAAKTSHAATIAKKTIVIIVAIAGSLGLAFLIWTGIRKWKFKPSSRFEDRMAPIDWQPTTDLDDPAEKASAHRRNGSAGSHGSFGSSDLAHGQQGGGVSRSASGHSVQRHRDDFGVPDHDFTAGPAELAPGPAYADLHRGPPQQDLMVQNGLNRGPSMNHGPMDDPYGGYQEYDNSAAPHHGYAPNAYAPPVPQGQDHGYGAPYRGY